jgi:predicted metal-dependent enzyme (double-stranded beta helix superfamily)
MASECLTPAQREGTPENYGRHILHADSQGRYTVVALVWRAGQYTPVHGHLTWCGYVVLEGHLVEQRFHENPKGSKNWQNDTVALPLGHIATTASGRADPHRLAHGGGPPAISLHVYGVPGDGICSSVNDVIALESLSATSL